MYILLGSFSMAFFGLVRSGLFSVGPESTENVLYSLPLFIASFVLLLTTLAQVALTKARKNAWAWVFLASLLLASGGYWYNALFKYNVAVVLTEGQSIAEREIARASMEGYVGKRASGPPFSLKLETLSAELSDDGMELRGLKAGLMVFGEGKPYELEVSDGRPLSVDGYEMVLGEFGYSPRFELMGEAARVLDSSFVSLKLFPPGSEDSFRLLSPVTYYLSYFPQKGEKPLRVRAARNRDLVYSGDLGLGEAFSFENASMSFPEVRAWATLNIIRNPGSPFIAAGIALGVISLLMIRVRIPLNKEPPGPGA